MVMSLKLKASRRLAALLGTAHAAAAVSTFLLDVGPGVQLLLVFALLLSLVRSVRRAALLSTRDAVVEMEWGEGGALNFRSRDGTATLEMMSCGLLAISATGAKSFRRSNGSE